MTVTTVAVTGALFMLTPDALSCALLRLARRPH